MDVIYMHCAGLDVHKKTVVACCMTPGPQDGKLIETRTFGTMTADLLALADWLDAEGVTALAGARGAEVLTRRLDWALLALFAALAQPPVEIHALPAFENSGFSRRQIGLHREIGGWKVEGVFILHGMHASGLFFSQTV